ncbi:MAG TPA: alcohol dehydrogenase catalytic domain-containing protein, partial [Bacteroidales bacterium]|nr:alcohol dehydrogenase catalytic domain-containing protein [Bacteroidales bacterium]
MTTKNSRRDHKDDICFLTMKAMILTGIRRIEITEKPVPEISQSDEVLIRIRSVGVCGSDIHYYNEGKIGSQVVK